MWEEGNGQTKRHAVAEGVRASVTKLIEFYNDLQRILTKRFSGNSPGTFKGAKRRETIRCFGHVCSFNAAVAPGQDAQLFPIKAD